jgi:hypothetical protein
MGSVNDHDLSGPKTGISPPTLSSNTLYTSERSNMDYFTLGGVCKRTGATENELAVFGLKENIDNALDFPEANSSDSWNTNSSISIQTRAGTS